MELNLQGKHVFITGASRGIGLAVARAFAREGAQIAMAARGRALIESEAKAIENDFSTKAIGFSMDVTKPGEIEKSRRIIEDEFGGLDILVNNAGVGTEETVLESKDSDWYRVWDLHVMSAVRTARAFVPYMKERGGGCILNTASICATQPLWYEPIYNTTKAALLMFGKCLSIELIPHNIRVNTVSPGLVLTPDWRKTAANLAQQRGITPEEYLDSVAESAPIKRFASPEEIAETYVFLASERSSYSVGSNFYLDGGWLGTVS
ncbi:SDR family oxidoreductase [Marispirochaeta aestuarii]|uniref:SDR family NAD(P)-dependent oxidoreductase n=1 Tax=Marispirochaeta aestuarii TaxID=1963862 RepID=UPI0029C6E207|nr:SDR family oxidoreductase [Marispirochaeta aestuarii]